MAAFLSCRADLSGSWKTYGCKQTAGGRRHFRQSCLSGKKQVYFMVRDRRFYRQFFSMLIVMVLQNVITLSVNLADNIMLGGYSEVSLSGVAAVNQVQFIYQQILAALGEGIVILGSQYVGKNQYHPVRKISAIAMRFGFGLCCILFAAASLFPHLILKAFTTDEAIIAQGMEYLNLIRFTYVFFFITQILLATLRATGVVNIALILSVTALVINCCINYTLIYGHFGAPRLGVTGAAIGTLTSRIAELLILLYFIKKKERKLNLTIRNYIGKLQGSGEGGIRTAGEGSLLKDYVRVTFPMFVVQGLWGFNNAIQNAILGHMTARAIAANSAATTLYSLVKSMPVATAGATAFIMGKTVGEGDMKKVKAYAKTFQLLFVCIGIVSGISLYFIRIPVLSLYKLEPETMKMADTFLKILSLIAVTMSYQMPCNNGITRGGGDTAFTMKLDLISIWAIVLPLSFVMAFVVKASPIVVMCCLNADQVFKCVPAFIKVNYGHYVKKLTR